jgi:hypothetical protein
MFLKTLGTIIAKGVLIISGLEPLIGPLFGTHAGAAGAAIAKTADVLNQIAAIVIQMEAIFQTPGSGPEKLQAAVVLAVNVIKASELVAGRKIIDEVLFMQGATNVVNGVVQILNSQSDKHLDGSGDPLPPIPPPVNTPVPAPSWSGANQPPVKS